MCVGMKHLGVKNHIARNVVQMFIGKNVTNAEKATLIMIAGKTHVAVLTLCQMLCAMFVMPKAVGLSA